METGCPFMDSIGFRCPAGGGAGAVPVGLKYSWFVRVSFLPRPRCGAGMGKRVRRPVSRVLSGASRPLDGHSSGTPVAGRLARPTRAESAGTRLRPTPCGASAVRPYSVLLPVGFAVPRPLPARAVRSCRTVSPLPAGHPGRTPDGVMAVCSLWHCPWGCPRRALPGTVFPWSPDFPHPAPCRALPSLRRGAERDRPAA